MPGDWTLRYCKATRTLASIFSAKAYLEAGTGQGKCGQIDRDALRWFFVTHRRLYGTKGATFFFIAPITGTD